MWRKVKTGYNKEQTFSSQTHLDFNIYIYLYIFLSLTVSHLFTRSKNALCMQNTYKGIWAKGIFCSSSSSSTFTVSFTSCLPYSHSSSNSILFLSMLFLQLSSSSSCCNTRNKTYTDESIDSHYFSCTVDIKLEKLFYPSIYACDE